MLVAVIVLAVTTVGALAALAWVLLRRLDQPSPDPALARAISAGLPPVLSSSATRRVITVEILNALELAATRGRMAGLAGTVAPGIVRRVVYDETIRTMRRQLQAERVVADVRLHVMAPGGRQPDTAREK